MSIHCSGSVLIMLCQLTPEHLDCRGKWLTLNIANTLQATNQDIFSEGTPQFAATQANTRCLHVYTNSFATLVWSNDFASSSEAPVEQLVLSGRQSVAPGGEEKIRGRS